MAAQRLSNFLLQLLSPSSISVSTRPSASRPPVSVNSSHPLSLSGLVFAQLPSRPYVRQLPASFRPGTRPLHQPTYPGCRRFNGHIPGPRISSQCRLKSALFQRQPNYSYICIYLHTQWLGGSTYLDSLHSIIGRFSMHGNAARRTSSCAMTSSGVLFLLFLSHLISHQDPDPTESNVKEKEEG